MINNHSRQLRARIKSNVDKEVLPLSRCSLESVVSVTCDCYLSEAARLHKRYQRAPKREGDSRGIFANFPHTGGSNNTYVLSDKVEYFVKFSQKLYFFTALFPLLLAIFEPPEITVNQKYRPGSDCFFLISSTIFSMTAMHFLLSWNVSSTLLKNGILKNGTSDDLSGVLLRSRAVYGSSSAVSSFFVYRLLENIVALWCRGGAAMCGAHGGAFGPNQKSLRDVYQDS
ncbi:hypothetical protein J6590_077043 [Homalodisca vitripennis]|nr:hypothetical protein J6590_077043 [Homalodisca vitripennis]